MGLHSPPVSPKRPTGDRRRPRPRAPRERSPVPWGTILPAAAAVGLAGIVYLNALHGPFVYDDLMTVVGNGSIRDLGQPLQILLHDVFRPVVNLSYAVDFAFWGLEPLGFHLTSLLLHMLNVGLLFAVAYRLAEDAGRATGASFPPPPSASPPPPRWPSTRS